MLKGLGLRHIFRRIRAFFVFFFENEEKGTPKRCPPSVIKAMTKGLDRLGAKKTQTPSGRAE